MHYHYFTLEQRSALEQSLREHLAGQALRGALEQLHAPDYGVCERCGADIPFTRLAVEPMLRRCAACAA